MPSYLIENGRLLLNCVPREGAAPIDFLALAAVEAELVPLLAAELPTTAGAANDVLAGFRGDLVVTAATQAAAVQMACDRLVALMRAAAPAPRNVTIDEPNPLHWIRISPMWHEVVGFVYDGAGPQLRHWSYDHSAKPFRGIVSFRFTLRDVTVIS